MDKKYDPVGQLFLRGKAAKLELDHESGDPVRFFMFAADLEKLVHGEFSYVRVFRDVDPSQRAPPPLSPR